MSKHHKKTIRITLRPGQRLVVQVKPCKKRKHRKHRKWCKSWF